MSRIEDRFAAPIVRTYQGRPLREIYLEAAEILDDRGFCKEEFGQDTHGPVCPAMAVMIAASGGFMSVQNQRAVFLDNDITWITAWADRPETTKADAIALLLKVAERF